VEEDEVDNILKEVLFKFKFRLNSTNQINLINKIEIFILTLISE